MFHINTAEWIHFIQSWDSFLQSSGYVFMHPYIKYKMQQIDSSNILNETCHFCDTSGLYQNKYIPKSKNEKILEQYGWKFDITSLLYVSPNPRGALHDWKTRQFLDDVRESERLYGEKKSPIWI